MTDREYSGITADLYGKLNTAFDFFNKELFGGTLPQALLTLQRKKSAYGYFCGERFEDGKSVTIDEIALNPSHFATRPMREVLSTLVHEMAHLWQHHFGKPGKGGYHNKEWGAKMKELGLWPSSTGTEGGKETGTKVSHYIITTGPYDRAYEQFLKLVTMELFKERFLESKARKTTTKVKYVCPLCDAKAWGKPDLSLRCGSCDDDMEEVG